MSSSLQPTLSPTGVVAEAGPKAPITFVIESSTRSPLNLGEVWAYRELLVFLAWRDVRVRYSQTTLGIAWAIIQPICTMLVFSVFFGRLAKVPSDGVPYPLFSYCALLPWQLFAQSVTAASTSLVTNTNLLTKVYFPRMIVPIAAVATSLVDFGASFIVLLGLLLYYGIHFTFAILWVPFLAVAVAITAATVGLWLSALTVRFRDLRHTVPFLVQLWMFATPVAYSASLVPDRYRTLYGLNPMVGAVDAFRAVLLGTPISSVAQLAVSGVTVGLALLGGLLVFRRMESTFADTL